MQNEAATYKPQSFLLAASPLFLVLFIDSMGLGLVFPILNSLIFDSNAHFLSSTLSPGMHNLIYGFTIGIFMLCWLFGAAFLGDLSDQIGRKKSLMICLLGAAFSYIFSAIAVILHSYFLLLVGRIVAGFTAGSQSIAQAAIVDISEPEDKARNLGLILFFTSLGFAFGPMVGGVLSDSALVSWFNFCMPFCFAATISLINALLLFLLFHETFFHEHKVQLKLYHAIEILISAFKNEQVRELSIILLVMIFGWSGFYSFIAMYLFHFYHFSAMETGLFMALMGSGFGIGTGFLIEPLTKRYSLQACVFWGCLLTALGVALMLLATKQIFAWFFVMIVAISIAVAYSTLLTLFSNQVDEDSQGWVMGITGAIMAFAFGINGLLVGLLADMSPVVPMLVTIICLVAAAILMKKIFKA